MPRSASARLCLLLGLLLLVPAPAAADDAGAIRSVIERQLDAFQRDDGIAAFSFAAPRIQEKFGTAEIFMEMVQRGYPAVYRPREVEFRRLQLEGDGGLQDVFFLGPDGQPQIGLYMMQRQPDGRWRINGVQMLRAPDSMT